MTLKFEIRDAVATRRQIHANPELGFLEIQTASLIWGSLRPLGWKLRGGQDLLDLTGYQGLPNASELDAAAEEARLAGVDEEHIERFRDGATTVIADLQGSKPGPRVAFRFDMDCLPVEESARHDHRPAAEGFRAIPGLRMHACGHDGHVAVGLRLAALLAANLDFPGSVRLIFQPAEEGVRGAHPIVAAGLCDDVDVMIAMHFGFGVELNSLSYATHLLGTSKFKTEFTGLPAHASNRPELGRNALLAAAHAILALHGLPAFSAADTRVNVGALIAGGAANIIPAAAVLHSEVRASTPDVHLELERRARVIFDACASITEVAVDTARVGYAVSAESSVGLFERLARNSGVCGFREAGAHPMRASDDATLMMERVSSNGGESCYLLVGSGTYGAHHSAAFDIDESVLNRTADLLEAFVRRG